MQNSFYFYDLETSGFNPKYDRIMQFAGQRTDMNLEPIGEPDNILIQLSKELLPSPDAIMVTGITPQKTIQEGVSEYEFMKIFYSKISLPGTIFLGYNTVRFDDEFMRYLQFRNFYDPYEWQWKDGRSRWDLLDVVRMCRALRPEGIKWPKDKDGKPTNRLELITELNGLEHANAHDALSDVYAVIDLAKLLRSHQPKLFDFLLDMRQKDKVAALVKADQPFVYSSGRYSSESEKTAVVSLLVERPSKQGAVVFDLKYNPDEFADMNAEEIVECWRYDPKNPNKKRFPAKTIRFNRCPAIAPMSVLDKDSEKRLGINQEAIKQNFQKLKSAKNLSKEVEKALDILDNKQQTELLEPKDYADEKLYDSFINDHDKKLLPNIRSAAEDVGNFASKISDKRLRSLLPLYKARNFEKSLSSEEKNAWENYCYKKLSAGSPNKMEMYMNRLAELAKKPNLSNDEQYLLEELQLYAEALAQELMPDDY